MVRASDRTRPLPDRLHAGHVVAVDARVEVGAELEDRVGDVAGQELPPLGDRRPEDVVQQDQVAAGDDRLVLPGRVRGYRPKRGDK